MDFTAPAATRTDSRVVKVTTTSIDLDSCDPLPLPGVIHDLVPFAATLRTQAEGLTLTDATLTLEVTGPGQIIQTGTWNAPQAHRDERDHSPLRGHLRDLPADLLSAIAAAADVDLTPVLQETP
ncbi:hypothetical protein [Cellulosimicrobium sp. Marseille-Q4280]|uniref:hypothetical protein n=1 Tax=Cellulosimicrobium sp. Marseille-Q4280 TaxID=2937992 RepID=UPI00203E6926|nr:hypothetical protein [Cellulosimicrobium sp. Marseille-Q4280]